MISKTLKKLFKKGGNYEKKLPLSKENNLTLLCMLLREQVQTTQLKMIRKMLL